MYIYLYIFPVITHNQRYPLPSCFVAQGAWVFDEPGASKHCAVLNISTSMSVFIYTYRYRCTPPRIWLNAIPVSFGAQGARLLDEPGASKHCAVLNISTSMSVFIYTYRYRCTPPRVWLNAIPFFLVRRGRGFSTGRARVSIAPGGNVEMEVMDEVLYIY